MEIIASMKMKCEVILLVQSIIYLCSLNAQAFNLSPKPNIIFKEPKLNTLLPKNESSYFGLSLILRESSVYVGAPRAQSALETQKTIKEPGVIYKCTLKTGACTPFNFDTKGNYAAEPNDYTWDSENKDYQWLGATMDGGSSDKDQMVVCAPKFFANSTSPEGYLMHGICYVSPNTLAEQPTGIRKISPLRLKNDQTREINDNFYFYNAYAQMGFSVHDVEGKDEIIFGAPGLGQWKGSMVQYRVDDYKNPDVSRSRRDIHDNRRKREVKKYKSEILQPEFWGQHNDTYFGYSVTSGYFHGPNSTDVLYLAAAPKSVSMYGEVYLFTIIKTRYPGMSISKHYTFQGTQFGEYFGYTMLAEDVNGDNYTDVIISAPNYYSPNSYENGAIYVFLNLGDIVFSEPTKIVSGKPYRERFGSAISKLGDINLDGFNDIAVGAPFSENGVVYIYLGGANGLRQKPSQILQSPTPYTPTAQPMFGFGLSKGVDFDANGYNDLAVGEPGDDNAYVYRSYPVVKIIPAIEFPSQQVLIEQKKIQVKICWGLQTKSKKMLTQDVNITVKFDPILKRVQIPSSSNTVFKALAKAETQCRIYDASVNVSVQYIFRPIEIEMSYELMNKIPNTNVFCESCAVVDPDVPNLLIQKLAFMTGCKSEKCVANLKIKSIDVKSPFILGSSSSITVKYIIRNEGETAYLPQINITSSNKMQFTKIPSPCKTLGFAILECNLNDYRPLGTNKTTSIVISFDSSNLQGIKTVIRAQVFSVGNELDPIDNVVQDVITFAEFSQIEVSGKPITPKLSLEDGLGVKNIKNYVEIRNHGPSYIKQMEITFLIPLAYIVPESKLELPLIDFNNITLVPKYYDRVLDVKFTQNGKTLIQSSSTQTARKGTQATTSSPKSAQQRVVSKDAVLKSISDKDYENIAKRPINTELAKELLGALPVNRTVFMNCYKKNEVSCVEATFTVSNMHLGTYINVSFAYTVDLDIVNKILIPEKDFFVVTTLVELTRLGDSIGTTTQMVGKLPNNIISKHHLYGTPIWIYIVSAIAGLLILLGVTYAMHKLGFFKRDKLQELQAAKHETQPLNEGNEN